ncbi:sigma-70 family RNA polymerase sigma factor [Bacteroides faecis]|nr:sigma-70 family RNA polymerase sigma factor [Bacteroides faecis]
MKSKKCTEEESLDTIIARLELSHHSNENHEETLFAKEIQQEIVNYLKGQPENVRKVFVLSRYHGLKIKEIARQLELSQKTVEKYLSRVLKGLKECLIYKELLSFYLFFLSSWIFSQNKSIFEEGISGFIRVTNIEQLYI